MHVLRISAVSLLLSLAASALAATPDQRGTALADSKKTDKSTSADKKTPPGGDTQKPPAPASSAGKKKQ